MKERIERLLRILDEGISRLSPQECAEVLAVSAAMLTERQRLFPIAMSSGTAFLVRLPTGTYMVTVEELPR